MPRILVASGALPMRLGYSMVDGPAIPSPPSPPPPPPPPAAPTVTVHPSNATVTEPTAANFTVAGTNYTSVQWRRTPPGGGSVSDIGGATATNYNTGPTSVAADNARQFLARLTGPGGVTDSNPALLTVNAGSPPPPPPPPSAGGTFRLLGTQTYKVFMDTVREAMPEGAASANARMRDAADQLAFCGAVIWRNKMSLGISGGHSAGYDDAHIAQDLFTGAWAVHYPSSDGTYDFAPLNEYGETVAAPNRPASAHSYFHQTAQGDNILNGVNYALLAWAGRSSQAHRWNGSLRGGLGQWERYSDNSSYPVLSAYHVFHDALRNRFIRYPMEFVGGGNVFQTIPDNDASATWSTIFPSTWPVIGPFASPGYHEALDAIVVADLYTAGTPKVWVAEPTNMAAGFTAVSVTGLVPPSIAVGGLEYIPSMRAFATTRQAEPSKLFYLRPNTTNKFGSWSISSETFVGPGGIPGSAWVAPGSTPMDSWSRCRWSEALKALVMIKGTQSLTEVWTPSEVADWINRSTEPGVVAAYDFSDPPANGGDWKWGSTQASPKTTVWAMDDASYSTVRVRDTVIAPPGSKASMRFDIPGPSGERADAWRLSLDNYADQFGENSEFWVQWRTRMNSVAATHAFLHRLGGTTAYKQLMIASGMQTPNVIDGTPRGSYGYPGSQNDNTMADARIDPYPEIVLIGNPVFANASVPAGFVNPVMYVSKRFDGTGTRGQDINYGTYHNGQGTFEDGNTTFNESAHVAACQWTNPGSSDMYTDWTTCFAYPTDEWFTMMVHVKLGAIGAGVTSLGEQATYGYTNSTLALYCALDHGKMQLIHKRTGVVFPIDQTIPQGSQGPQKYGQFGFTTFMTQKDFTEAHATAKIWYAQLIVKSGPTPIGTPI